MQGSPFIKEDLLLNLYYSLVQPHLISCNIVWGNNYNTRLDSLIKMQKKVGRVITFSSHTESSLPLFQKLEILNVEQLNNQQTVSILNSQLHSYVTRRSNNIHYYTMYSLSVFSLAKILQLILEISATYRLVSYLLADN